MVHQLCNQLHVIPKREAWSKLTTQANAALYWSGMTGTCNEIYAINVPLIVSSSLVFSVLYFLFPLVGDVDAARTDLLHRGVFRTGYPRPVSLENEPCLHAHCSEPRSSATVIGNLGLCTGFGLYSQTSCHAVHVHPAATPNWAFLRNASVSDWKAPDSMIWVV